MTEFDKKLIEKAWELRKWDYEKVDALIEIADTDEAKEKLGQVRRDLMTLAKESL